MRIQHNMTAANCSTNFGINGKDAADSAEKLSTGYRINRAADDAAGLTITEKMRWQIRGLNRAAQNIEEGVALVKVADGALEEVHSMLQRMGELAVQGANDTNTPADRQAIQDEINQIKSEINRISKDTEYNGIRLFKPTTMPQLSGSPWDVRIYHEDLPGGGTRAAGIVYSGRRYSYEELQLPMDINENIITGTHIVQVENDLGEMVSIPLIFDGGTRVPSGREYELDPSKDGIRIDGILHEWEKMQNERGEFMDVNNIRAGTYSFMHAGMTVSFEVRDGTDLGSLQDELRKDGLSDYTLRTEIIPEPLQPINPAIGFQVVQPPVTFDIQDFIPGSRADNLNQYAIEGYGMRTSDDGIWMYIKNPLGGTVDLTLNTWEELGLAEWMDGDDSNPNVNPDVTTEFGEDAPGAEKIYTYVDRDYTGFQINFKVDNEVSHGELKKAIEAWQINCNTDNRMNFEISNGGASPISIRVGSHSPNLDAYGTHYYMGRNMSTQMVLTTNQHVAVNGEAVSFTMTDANGTVYTMQADGVDTNVKNQVENAVSTYISRFTNSLNYGYGADSSFSNGITLHSQDGNGYTLDLNYNFNLSSLNLTRDMFDATTDPITHRTTYTWNPASNARIAAAKEAVINNIVSALKDVTVTSVKTDNGPPTASLSVKSPLETRNARYSSLSIEAGRDIKIQSGALGKQYIQLDLPSMNSSILRVGGVDVSTHENATAALLNIYYGIEYVSRMRSGYGATQNRMEHAIAVNEVTAENTQAAESLLRDTDYADEVVVYAKHNILAQAGQAILAQSYRSGESVLNLLQP